MAKVILYPGETIDSALGRFQTACKRDGVFREMKAGMQYKKPSDTKREKALKAEQRYRQRQRKRA